MAAKDQIPHVEPQKDNLQNSPIKQIDPATAAICYWNGQPYSEGAAVCQDHKRYICWHDGTWLQLGSC
jgi:hypothetical protein